MTDTVENKLNLSHALSQRLSAQSRSHISFILPRKMTASSPDRCAAACGDALIIIIGGRDQGKGRRAVKMQSACCDKLRRTADQMK